LALALQVLRMTRDERLEWCKARAREYLQRGELGNAVASIISDMNQSYPELPPCPPELAIIGIRIAADGDRNRVENFIEGFR
jgi:hypothetical protein